MPFKAPGRAAQLHVFDGMEIGKTSPSDLDMIYELKGQFFVFGEGKKHSAELPTGQRIMLENLVDALEQAGRYAVAFVYDHNTPSDSRVLVARCVVREYYTSGKWQRFRHYVTVKRFLLAQIEKSGLQV